MFRTLFIRFLLCIGLIGSLSFYPLQAQAAPSLTVDAEIGYNNKLKSGITTPLTVTVQNNGEDFQGDLIVHGEVNYSFGSDLVYPIEIASGESTTLKIILDSYSESMHSRMPKPKLFSLYEGDYGDGVSVDYDGTQSVDPRMYSMEEKFVLAVGDDMTESTYAMVSNLATIERITKEDLPTDVRALTMIDALFLQNEEGLSEQQKQMLSQYEQLGGTIITDVEESAIAASIANITPISLNANVMDVEGWQYVNELFPSFKFSTGLIVILLVFYILLIGPGLYMVLKKFDKREQMWLYVPVISVICSVAFFMFGAKDRMLQPQVQEMALYEVQDGFLTGGYSQALLSNKSGDFTFTVEGMTTAFGKLSSNLNGTKIQSVYEVEDKNFTLEDLSYWSVQSFAGQSTIPSNGIETKLQLNNGQLTGEIMNHLPVDLAGMEIYSGSHVYELGELKANESLAVGIKMDTKMLLGSSYYAEVSSDASLYERKWQALQTSTLAGTNGKYEPKSRPILFAWSDASIGQVQYDGEHDLDALTGFVVPLTDVETIMTGSVSFTTPDFTVGILPDSSDIGYAYIENEQTLDANIGEGSYQVNYQLTANNVNLAFNRLQLNGWSSNIDVAILNQQTKAYEKLDRSWETADVASYLSNHQLILQVTRVGMDDGQIITLPHITLQGVAK